MTPPTSDLRARVLAAASAQGAPTRSRQRVRTIVALGLAVLCLAALAGMHGVAGLIARPSAYVAVILVGFALVASHVLSPLGAYRHSPLGPTRGALLRRARLAPLWLVGITLLANAVAPSTWAMPASALRPHATCFELAFGVGVAVALCAFYILRGTDPVAPRALGTSLGILAGTMAALCMTVACSLADPIHVLLSHVLPVLVLGALAGWAGARVLRTPSL